MRIGKLDRRITVERATYAQNEYGEAVETWATLCTVWAERVLHTRGNEALTAGMDITTVPVHWVVRYSTITSTITHGDRIQYAGDVYNVLAVLEMVRGVGVKLVTELVK
jgi:SPP1 family predicted phage head-tail adaptor